MTGYLKQQKVITARERERERDIYIYSFAKQAYQKGNRPSALCAGAYVIIHNNRL